MSSINSSPIVPAPAMTSRSLYGGDEHIPCVSRVLPGEPLGLLVVFGYGAEVGSMPRDGTRLRLGRRSGA